MVDAYKMNKKIRAKNQRMNVGLIVGKCKKKISGCMVKSKIR